MKRIVVISTYRNRGTKNIGDRLIAHSIVSMLEAEFSEEVSVDVIFRAADWDEVKEVVMAADHLIFACVPVRSRLGIRLYPYMQEILDSGKHYSVLAAGTDMPIKEDKDFTTAVDAESIALLRKVAEGAAAFTSRGILTQHFLEEVGVKGSTYEGDVAFYSPERYGQEFAVPAEVKRIVISDPHRPDQYLNSFELLHDGLRELFPSAEITVALHGVNEIIEDYCKERRIAVRDIYSDPEGGLSVYDDCDLHVGYRVHGHVSALKARRLSYLLEQDGRGADYGLTLSRKVSVPHFLQRLTGPDGEPELRASIAPPQQMLSLLRQDKEDGFSRFAGWGAGVEMISRRAEATVARIVASIG